MTHDGMTSLAPTSEEESTHTMGEAGMYNCRKVVGFLRVNTRMNAGSFSMKEAYA